MSETLTAVRGMADHLPHQTPLWHYLEQQLRQVCQRYGYGEINFPLVERTALFQRSIGEATDIVEKEMFSFADRNGDSLTLRPEGTAGCVRAAIQHGLLYNQQQRFFYHGPMFRYERPQKGRQRQFQQFGVEAFGFVGPDIDAELLAMNTRCWQQLGLTQHLSLQLNSLGDQTSRQRYRAALVNYLQQHKDRLDSDSQRRLSTNPLRILDSKDTGTQSVLAQAPLLTDYLDQAAQQHFTQLCQLLDQAKVAYQINPRLVRGLDYYSGTVFEWVAQSLGAQSTLCAGGRYDNLVAQLGGPSTSATGFAIGMERLVLLLETLALIPDQLDANPHAYLVSLGQQAQNYSLVIAEQLRQALPSLRLINHCGGGSAKSQFKKADKSRAAYALVLGEQELADQQIALQPLRNAGESIKLSLEQLVDYLKQQII
jgi:histidyl-tRNA synthetase